MNILPIPKPLPSIPLYNDINKNNIIELQLIINYIIDSSSLISLDTEFTGLGKISDGIRASYVQKIFISFCQNFHLFININSFYYYSLI